MWFPTISSCGFWKLIPREGGDLVRAQMLPEELTQLVIMWAQIAYIPCPSVCKQWSLYLKKLVSSELVLPREGGWIGGVKGRGDSLMALSGPVPLLLHSNC